MIRARRSLAAFIAAGIVLVGGTAALAYFTASGSGLGAQAVGSLGTPAPVSAGASTGTVTVSWSVVASPSGISDDLTYSVDRSGNGGSSWTPASGTCAGSIARTTSSCQETVASGTYVYRVTAHYKSWTSQATGGPVTVVSDATPPTSSITFPTSGGLYTLSGYNAGCATPSTGDVCGTASDPGAGASGVNKVQVALQRSSDSNYWNGSVWVSGVQWNDASGTTSWAYAFSAANLTSGVTYTVQSRAIDNAANVQTTPDSKTFTYDATPPTVSSINRQSPSGASTNASSVTFRVTFSEAVAGVDATDFARTVTGTLSGLSTGTVTTVNASTYDVAVNTGSGDGSLRLDVTDDDSIADTAGNKLGGTGTGNGTFTTGQTYTIDRTNPTASITANPSNPSNQTTVSFTFTTADPSAGGVSSGVNHAECALDASGFSSCTSPASYSSLSAGSHTFLVRAIDNAGNTGSAASYTWTIDTTSPTVSSINRQSPSGASTNASSVTFRVTFSEAVAGVDATDFARTVTGTLSGLSTGTVTTVNASTYDVAVNTGSGDGSLRLDVTDDDSIADTAGNKLGGTGTGNGTFTTGQTYTIDRTAPTVTSIALAGSSPTNAGSVSWTVTFSESVTGVSSGNFSLVSSGLGGTPAITGVSGSASSWTVAASTGSGSGTLRLDKTSNAGVSDGVGNGMAGGTVTGAAYSIDRINPSGTDVQATNNSGGTVGKAEAGDKITFTFSETMSAASILAGWNGSSTNVTVHLDRTGTNGPVLLTVTDSSDATAVNLGSVDLVRSDYLAGNGTKHGTFASSSMVQSGSTITITLGTYSGDTLATAGATGTMSWTPSSSATDAAGNPTSTTAAVETGAADKEF